jgi:FdhD protein
LFELPARLSAHQPAFRRTGGAHAAAAFDVRGSALAAAEDVGRHNAVDKVIGRLLLSGALSSTESPAALLFVSGRTSFEIVQKALSARIGLVAGVSAPSSLAVALAEHAGITLVGFVRDGHANVYTHPQRLEGAPVSSNGGQSRAPRSPAEA